MDITDQLDFLQASPENDDVEIDPSQDEAVKGLLLNLLRKIETSELPTREILLRQWKLNELLWQGIQSVAWSSVANEWQILDSATQLPQDITIDPSIFNKVVNIIRPYGESIAGALATGIPSVRYFPYNADDPADITTAKTFSKIEKLIGNHNKVELLLLKALIYQYKYGFAAAYNYEHQSEEYGTVEKQETELRDFNVKEDFCTNCGTPINSEEYECPKDFNEGVEASLGEETPESLEEVVKEQAACPVCKGMQEIQSIETPMQKEVEVTNEYGKYRQLIQILGPMEVKIPTRAKTQNQVLWLIYEDEFHVAELKSLFPDYADKITSGSGSTTAYERYIRSNWEEYYENLNDYATCDRVWLRPSSYYILGEDEASQLRELFPEGVMFTVVNNNVVEVKEEKLDDHWTLTINPGDNRIYADPGCKSTVPMQFLTNEIMQLEVECFKYALPTSFADPEFLDFTAYSASTKTPGLIYPMKKPPNGNMADNVASLITANYPTEAKDLDAKVEKLSQFTSGALPQIWGGPTSKGSGTLGQFEQEKNQAMQRLGIPYKVILYWYASLMGKSIKCYIKKMQSDEYFVQEHGDSFINVWIKKSDLLGKIGDILPEVGEQFPSNWAQTSAKVMELIGMQNEMINGILAHPENISLIAKTIGVPDLYVPGENERNKELFVIAQVLHTPENVDPMTGIPAPIMAPPVNPLIDNPALQSETLKAFLSSDVGVDLETSNASAYQALIGRMMEFQQIIMQQQMMAAAQQQDQEVGNQVEAPPA